MHEWAMIMKKRARRPIAAGVIGGLGYHPHGVGGFPTSAPCISVEIGEHRIIMNKMQWFDMLHRIETLMESA